MTNNINDQIKNLVNLERLKAKHYNNQVLNNSILRNMNKMRNMHNIKNQNIVIEDININDVIGGFY